MVTHSGTITNFIERFASNLGPSVRPGSLPYLDSKGEPSWSLLPLMDEKWTHIPNGKPILVQLFYSKGLTVEQLKGWMGQQAFPPKDLKGCAKGSRGKEGDVDKPVVILLAVLTAAFGLATVFLLCIQIRLRKRPMVGGEAESAKLHM